MLTSASAARQAGDGLTPFHGAALLRGRRGDRRGRRGGRLRRHPDRARRRRRPAADDGRGRHARAPSTPAARTISRSATPRSRSPACRSMPPRRPAPPAASRRRGRARLAPFAARGRACSPGWPATAARIRDRRDQRADGARGGRGLAVASRSRPRPRDQALLELAAKLCQTERRDERRLRSRSTPRRAAAAALAAAPAGRCPASPSCSASARWAICSPIGMPARACSACARAAAGARPRRRRRRRAPQPPASSRPPPAAPRRARARSLIDPEIARRVAALEQRFGQIDSSSRAPPSATPTAPRGCSSPSPRAARSTAASRWASSSRC